MKYKSQYKANHNTVNTLSGNRAYAMKHDTNLQVAAKGTRTSASPVAYRSKTMASNYPMASSRHVKTSVIGARGVVQGTWADGRAKYSGGNTAYRPRNSSVYKGTGGRTAMERGGYSRPGNPAPYRGTTRMKNGYSGSHNPTPYRSRGTWSPSYNGGGRSGSPAPMLRGYSGSQMGSPSYKGWSGGSWGGGSRGGFSGGGYSGGGHAGGGKGR